MHIILLLVAVLAQEVRVNVNPRLSLPPATVEATITVPRNPDNRELIIVLADEYDEISHSEIPLNGDQECPQFFRIFDHLPAGKYRVTAVLIRTNRKIPVYMDFEVIK